MKKLSRSYPLKRLNKRLIVRVIIDSVIAVTLFLSLFTGIVDWLFIPDGRQSGYFEFLGVSKHVWVDLHLYSSLLLTGVLVFHLILNYKVFMAMSKALYRSEPKESQ